MQSYQRNAWDDLELDGWDFVKRTRQFSCGYCDTTVSTRQGLTRSGSSGQVLEVRLCPSCRFATNHVVTYQESVQFPQSIPGPSFQSSDEDEHVDRIVRLYDQARRSMRERASSAAVLVFRKLLMHIAVEKGAEEGKRFVDYCDHLKDNNIVASTQHHMLDTIRKEGNTENHEIRLATPDEATRLLRFVAHLIDSIYFMK